MQSIQIKCSRGKKSELVFLILEDFAALKIQHIRADVRSLFPWHYAVHTVCILHVGRPAGDACLIAIAGWSMVELICDPSSTLTVFKCLFHSPSSLKLCFSVLVKLGSHCGCCECKYESWKEHKWHVTVSRPSIQIRPQVRKLLFEEILHILFLI